MAALNTTINDVISNVDLFITKCPKSGALQPLGVRGTIWRAGLVAARDAAPEPFTQSAFRAVVTAFAEDADKCASAAEMGGKTPIVTAAKNCADMMRRACTAGETAVDNSKGASKAK